MSQPSVQPHSFNLRSEMARFSARRASLERGQLCPRELLAGLERNGLLKKRRRQGFRPKLRGVRQARGGEMNAIVAVRLGQRVVIRTRIAVRHLTNDLFLHATNDWSIARWTRAIHDDGKLGKGEVRARLID